MARNPYRRYEVTEYQKEALKFLQPPEDITVSEWADKYRVTDSTDEGGVYTITMEANRTK